MRPHPLLLLFAALFPLNLQAADKPNIVYIMADELGYYELSHMGSKTIQTPRIDRMAKEGIRFTQGLTETEPVPCQREAPS